MNMLRLQLWTKRAYRFLLVLLLSTLGLVAQLYLLGRVAGSRGQSQSVCIMSADLFLVPTSRGTADALMNLAFKLLKEQLPVHLVLVSSKHELCLQSINAVTVRAHSLKRQVTATCVIVDDSKGTLPLTVQASVSKHFQKLGDTCSLLITHEWWSLHLDLLVMRTFPASQDLGWHLPFTIVNVHGGTMWSSSWANLTQRAVADYILDSKERACAALSDALVFPNQYMHDYHAKRWALPSVNTIIPNIVKASDARRLVQAELLPIQGIAFVGAVERRKGIDSLVAVLAELKHLRIRFEVFGSIGKVGTTGADEYMQKAMQGTTHILFKLHGALPLHELWPYLSRERLLLVAPSLLENQPTTLMYASLHRVPVLSYDVGGVADMLQPESRSLCLLPPNRVQLKARLEKALSVRQAHVPALNAAMFSSHRQWMRLIRSSTSHKRSGVGKLQRGVAVDTGYTTLHLTSQTTTDSVSRQLELADVKHTLVLLLLPGYHVTDSATARITQLANQLDASSVVGVTAHVLMSDHSVLFPEPPFFLLSSAWQGCNPAAPVLVKRRWLTTFLRLHNGMPFRLWFFTLWLLYGNEHESQQIILRVPEPLFSFRGCIDALDCFWYSTAIEAPAVMLKAPREFTEHRLPARVAADRRRRMHSDFPELLSETCNAHPEKPSAEWMALASAPQLCKGSIEHGMFSLQLLKTALLQSCGAHCVFTLGREPHAPATSLGWSLDTAHACWKESGSDDKHCMPWFDSRARMLPSAVDCPLSPEAPHDVQPTCAPGQLPGSGCSPRSPSLIVAGMRGCALETFSDLLSQALPRPGGAVAAPSPSARVAFYTAASPVSEAVASAFWAQFSDEPQSFDDTVAFIDHSPQLPFATKERLPAAKVVFLLCEPYERLKVDFEAARSHSDTRQRDHALLARLRIDDFEQLARRIIQPCNSNLGFEACQLLRQQFLERSVYAATIADWVSAFGNDAVLAVDCAALNSEPAATLAKVFTFAGWPPPPDGFASLRNDKNSRTLTNTTGSGTASRELASLLTTANSWLADLISADFPLHWKPGS